MKLRLICRYCVQVGPDDFNTVWKTYEVEVNDPRFSDPKEIQCLKDDLAGVEVVLEGKEAAHD